ncbi:MAG: hypothetical protein MN733_33935, partial [Nitrososphaera sp.]|nr:hypothetical protein [Nitrososphaera sp.]
YPHTRTILRLDRPPVVTTMDAETEILRQMLPESERPEQTSSLGNQLSMLTDALQAAERSGDLIRQTELQQQITELLTKPVNERSSSIRKSLLPIAAADISQTISDSLALKTRVTMRPAIEIARQGGVASVAACSEVQTLLSDLSISQFKVVDDIPIITVTFGYTRREWRTTYTELNAEIKTRLRPFPVLDADAARSIGQPSARGTIPILAREGEHEGLFLALDQTRVLRWLEINGVILPTGTTPPIVRILAALEEVDPFYEDIWKLQVRRLVFGLLHSFSHAALKAASRFAGLDRTSLSEYLFLPLLGTVIYANDTTFKLGGMEAIARDNLLGFLRSFAERDGSECLYDNDCRDRTGSCHGCLQLSEICCRFFNHGLSRSFLIGGHKPWLDVTRSDRISGYWEIS